jgi:hypothetical protein
MKAIVVRKIDESTFEVTVASRTPTTHKVTADPAYAAQLTRGALPTETLIRRSFEFLLEREPNTSILRQFDLPVIGRYFPEYERTIRVMLQTE